MAKVGISLKIDVSKIQKDKMFKGEKGTYLDATIFVDLEQADQYGNHGMITQSWKDSQKGDTPILGNGKIFWRDGAQPQQQTGGFQPHQQQPQQHQAPSTPQEPAIDFDDDMPF